MPTYEVRTIEWMHYAYSFRPHQVRSPVFAVVSTHPAYADAVAACDDVNVKAWADEAFNPFLYGGETLFFQSPFPPGPFCDYLEDRGLDVPGADADNAEWVEWFARARPGSTAAQLAGVQQAMSLIRFAEVVEVPDAVPEAYILQQLNWSYDPDADSRSEEDEGPTWLEPDEEGGVCWSVYSDRTKAEARCAELNAARQALPDYYGFVEFDSRRRQGVTEAGPTPIAATRFYDVVAVEACPGPLEQPAASGVAYVVYRQAYRAGRPISNPSQGPSQSRVALTAFAELPTAVVHVTELLRQARRTTNPFASLERCHKGHPRDLAIPWRVPPQWGFSHLKSWYDAEAPHLTDDERAKVWSLFDARPLYGIYEVPLGDE